MKCLLLLIEVIVDEKLEPLKKSLSFTLHIYLFQLLSG